MASSSHLSRAFGVLEPSSTSIRRNDELLAGLHDEASFALPEVDNVDAFERQVVNMVKPNHGACIRVYVYERVGIRGERTNRKRTESGPSGCDPTLALAP